MFAAILPEQNDTDLSDDQMIARINEELVATWGNLVNRVLSITAKNFESVTIICDPADYDPVLSGLRAG